MLDNLPGETRKDIVPRRRDLDIPRLRHQLGMQAQKQTLHKRYNPTGEISNWTSYASQRYVDAGLRSRSHVLHSPVLQITLALPMRAATG